MEWNWRLDACITGCLILLYAVNSIHASTFVITHNIDVNFSILDQAVLKRNVVSIQLCTQLCALEPDCHNAVYDKEFKWCYLFMNRPAIALDLVNKSRHSYIEDECSQSLDNVQGEGSLWASCGSMGETVYADCHDAHTSGIRKNGLYFLSPNGTDIVFQAYCVFDENQGWTVILKRMPREGQFTWYRLYEELRKGAGVLSSEYFSGLESIYWLTRANKKLSVFLEAWDDETRYANYTEFYVDGSDVQYTIHISGYSGDAGDSLSYSNGLKFTTWDQDNDIWTNAGYDDNCAIRYRASWWYKTCHASNLLGRYYYGGDYADFATGTSWHSWKGHYYGYKNILMMIGH